MSLFSTHGGHFSHLPSLSAAQLGTGGVKVWGRSSKGPGLAWQLCTVWRGQVELPQELPLSSPCSTDYGCPDEQESGPGCALHCAALLPELAGSWELCTCILLRVELRHPQPHTHPCDTMHRPITLRKPRGLSREVSSGSKGCPDCTLVETSKPLPSLPVGHFLPMAAFSLCLPAGTRTGS